MKKTVLRKRAERGLLYSMFGVLLLAASCSDSPPVEKAQDAAAEPGQLRVSRSEYIEKMHGFWLGQCIANFTGRVTEMDKVGDTHDFKTMPFYTREDWGQADQPAIWEEEGGSGLSPTIDFIIRGPEEVWNSDDDTDIEYMYQHLLYTHQTSMLSAEQIRDGWLKHIWSEEENYLWGSNQETYNLMQKGLLPPETADKEQNPNWFYIDAQLTTEIFGLFAPGRPDVARKMAQLPIRAVAREDAEWIAEFYVVMHALASSVDSSLSLKEQLFWLASEARKVLPDDSTSAKMYEFVWSRYEEGVAWEQARDEIYQRYQIERQDGYDVSGKGVYCDGCFGASINFAASLVSLFWGEGDIVETTKIGTLAGWDSDNPTSTWGGLLGFMLGKRGVEAAFGQVASSRFNIHHSRQAFPNDGQDTFENMAEIAAEIVDRVVREELQGTMDADGDVWRIPLP